MKTIPILNIRQFEEVKPVHDFYSNDLESHLKKNDDIVYKPHKHDFFLCILFTKGTGLHEIDFNTYAVEPGSVFFLKPGQTHSWEFETKPEGFIFFHSKDFYQLRFSNCSLEQFPFYYSHKNTPSLVLTKDQTTELHPKFKELNNEYYQNLPYQEIKITSIINTIYIDLARHYIDSKPQEVQSSLRYLEILQSLENEIDHFYQTNKSAKFYADRLNISSKHLNRIVKTTLDKTTTDLIFERVLLEAKRLIVHSNNSLTAIAEILGYEDYAYFSKVFKSKTKTTPLAFKKKYL
jgi:AraC family transcriptional activator of pobA